MQNHLGLPLMPSDYILKISLSGNIFLGARMLNYLYRAECVNVVDGDTIDVDFDLGFRMHTIQRLRLQDLDTYELRDRENKYWAEIEKSELISLVMSTNLIIHSKKTGKYGRWIAMIWIEAPDGKPGLCVNDHMREFHEKIKIQDDALK